MESWNNGILGKSRITEDRNDGMMEGWNNG
jgi:hypothetical protein